MKIGVACLLVLLLFSTFGAAPVPTNTRVRRSYGANSSFSNSQFGVPTPLDLCLGNCEFKSKQCLEQACWKADGSVKKGECLKPDKLKFRKYRDGCVRDNKGCISKCRPLSCSECQKNCAQEEEACSAQVCKESGGEFTKGNCEGGDLNDLAKSIQCNDQYLRCKDVCRTKEGPPCPPDRGRR